MRVSVVGNSGSGKSTAARRMAEQLGLARLELDSIRHQPGWVELPDDEFCHRVREFMDAHDRWVIDGNYSVVQPEVWERAEVVVWMDPPKLENMGNIVGRTLRRVVGRQELWNGNRERWTNLLSTDPYQSVIAWAYTRHQVYRERYSAAMQDPRWRELTFIRLRSRAEFETWLAATAKAKEAEEEQQ